MANKYPNEEFQGIYDSILSSMGDDATLRANIEAALRPSYDKSLQELDRQRRENNAMIDVDAASRGMAGSSWVTDAKLQQLRGMQSDRANLEASYNSTLYGQLLDAIRERDNNAYSQAMQMYQLNHKEGGGSGGGIPDWFKTYLESQNAGTPPVQAVSDISANAFMRNTAKPNAAVGNNMLGKNTYNTAR